MWSRSAIRVSLGPCLNLDYDEADYFLRARVRAALRAAATRPLLPLVCTAFRAAAFKDPAPRLRAADRACVASAGLDAADRPSRRRAVRIAPARLADGLRPERDRLSAYSALRRVRSDAFPLAGEEARRLLVLLWKDQSQLPVWSIVRRASPLEHDVFPHVRTRRLARWRLTRAPGSLCPFDSFFFWHFVAPSGM